MCDLPRAARPDDMERTARVRGVCGALLAGGASSRFGSDKFVYEHDGEALGIRAARALAGVATLGCWLQGGGEEHARLTGWEVRRGVREGSGPLGALIDALECCPADVLVSLPCDMPGIRSADLARLVEFVTPDADAAVATADSRHQWLVAAWNVRILDELRSTFDAGERSMHRAVRSLHIVDVPMDEGVLANLNRRPV